MSGRGWRSGIPSSPMPFDLAFRHQQALDPSALTTIATTLHALQAAITDCRNAGADLESDPAVTLLARHFATVCGQRPADRVLRRSCIDAIAALRRHPALLTLAVRGAGHDEAAKALFHAEGRRALRRLADELDLEETGYDLRSDKGGVAGPGELTLDAGCQAPRTRPSGCSPEPRGTAHRYRGRHHDRP